MRTSLFYGLGGGRSAPCEEVCFFVGNKKPSHWLGFLKFGAQEKTRTSTTVKSLIPETSASTNSATWALQQCSPLPVRSVASVYLRSDLSDHFTKFGAQEKTRTSTTLRSLIPETSASTNSATWALKPMIAHLFRVTTSARRCGRELYGRPFTL